MVIENEKKYLEMMFWLKHKSMDEEKILCSKVSFSAFRAAWQVEVVAFADRKIVLNNQL